jgi:predicted ATP-dependent endonuclease of OLD family
MKINCITVKGFRNVKDISLTFSELTALVSLNSFGKSNVISAIDFALSFIQIPIIATRKQMMSWKKGIPLNKNMDKEDFFFEMEGDCVLNQHSHSVKYGFVFRWAKKDGSGRRIIKEWLKAKPHDNSGKYTNYIDRSESKTHYRTSESGRCSNNIKVANEELILDKLVAHGEIYYDQIVSQIATTTMCIERHLDATSVYVKSPFIRKAQAHTIMTKT